MSQPFASARYTASFLARFAADGANGPYTGAAGPFKSATLEDGARPQNLVSFETLQMSANWSTLTVSSGAIIHQLVYANGSTVLDLDPELTWEIQFTTTDVTKALYVDHLPIIDHNANVHNKKTLTPLNNAYKVAVSSAPQTVVFKNSRGRGEPWGSAVLYSGSLESGAVLGATYPYPLNETRIFYLDPTLTWTLQILTTTSYYPNHTLFIDDDPAQSSIYTFDVEPNRNYASNPIEILFDEAATVSFSNSTVGGSQSWQTAIVSNPTNNTTWSITTAATTAYINPYLAWKLTMTGGNSSANSLYVDDVLYTSNEYTLPVEAAAAAGGGVADKIISTPPPYGIKWASTAERFTMSIKSFAGVQNATRLTITDDLRTIPYQPWGSNEDETIYIWRDFNTKITMTQTTSSKKMFVRFGNVTNIIYNNVYTVPNWRINNGNILYVWADYDS